MDGGSSARIGAMRVRWHRPNARQAPLSPTQVVQAITYALFTAFVAVALLEIVGFQLMVCGGDGDCEDLASVHGAYLGIVVGPTALIFALLVGRWNAQRMRTQNADAEWVKKQAGTK